MSRHRYANVFRDATAGVDGTLRLRNTLLKTICAKTGSLSSAASLSGVDDRCCREARALVMVNNYENGVEPRQICIDPIAVLLASFTGKSDQ